MNAFQQVLDVLTRERAAGAGFQDAWSHALGALPESRSHEATIERDALISTRRAWSRAYRGELPTRGERAAGRLFGLARD